MKRTLGRIGLACLLLSASLGLTGCFYGPPGPGGFCYYHPYRCR